MTPRLFVAAPLAAGRAIELAPTAVRHVHALRLQPGDVIALFDGNDDRDWTATIVEMKKSRVAVRIDDAVGVARELSPAVTLAIGVPANERMDALVEKAGELGAAAIQPLVCARSVVRLAGERAEARQRRWQAIAAAASEQCGRARVCDVLPIVSLAEWLGAADEAATRFVLSLARSALAPEQAWSAASEGPAPSRVVVLSGPEGGLTVAEEDAAVGAGFVRVGLGPRTLRADTAPLAWLAWFAARALEPPRRER